jgi:PBSX family phage portal protein
MPTNELVADLEEHVAAKRALKADVHIFTSTKMTDGVLHSEAKELEDEFTGMYVTDAATQGTVLPPPFDLRALRRLVHHNNILLQAVTAMEVNIDGTGHVVEVLGPDGTAETPEDNDAEAQKLRDFFKEPYPGRTWIGERRQIRRDLEETGVAYLEILRNPAREIMFAHRVESTTIRLLKLDTGVPVVKLVMRSGKMTKVTLMERQRRYIQMVGQHKVYFKDFDVERDINKDTGEWAEKGQQLPSEQRGTEIIMMTLVKHTDSAYGVPRWVNQLPSVLGSRKAEELNNDFFDSGGIPPVVVFVEGGTMAVEAREQLQSIFNRGTTANMRAAVVDLVSASGSLEGAGSSVGVQVERFGSSDASDNDAQFQQYDERTAMRVRTAFRLPPIFLGMMEDYSFATAYASYTVAEAQVFGPERQEFDDLMNLTLVRGLLGPETKYVLRSVPLQVNDAESQLQATKLAADYGAVSGEDLVDSLNEITNTNIKHTDMEIVTLAGATPVGGASTPTGPKKSPEGRTQPGKAPAKKEDDPPLRRVLVSKQAFGAEEMVGLALQYMNAGRRRAEGDEEFGEVVFKRVDDMTPMQKDVFAALCRSITLPEYTPDPAFDVLLTEAVGCAGHDN